VEGDNCEISKQTEFYTIKMKIKNALDKKNLNKFLRNANSRIITKIRHDIGDLLWFWMGTPTLERIESLESKYSYLNEFIDFQIVKERLSNIKDIEEKEEGFNKIIGIHISKIFPELEEIKNVFESIINDLPKGIEKAELVLYPIALEAGTDGDMEAAIYFAAQGEYLLDPMDIRSEWHRVICLDIERGRPISKVPEEIIERARSGTLSLTEASEILRFNDDLPRFFGFRDEEEDFIDSTFIRSVEWFEVKGFQPWVDSISNELSTIYQYGIEHNRAAWSLFYWCRSDLIINKTEKFGLESFLFGLLNGPIEKSKPWKTSWFTQKTIEYVDYLPIASSIVFCWYRIDPKSFRSDVLESAIELLFQTQLNCGGWPLISNESEGSLLSTCLAIHALALAKPKGWKSSLNKAKEWLINNQNNSGFWHIDGGPIVMLTVLALESIHLASDNTRVSFRIDKSIEKHPDLINETDEDSHFDYSNEVWYKSPIPKVRSISKDEAINIFMPKIALITAVEVEQIAVLKKLKPPKGKRNIWKVFDGGETYYLGRFGEFDAVVTLSEMGSQGASGSTLTIDSLIRIWNPIGLIMVGIAFGANKRKHKAGDVLIANSIIPYENQRVGDTIIYRSPVIPSSHELINRIRNIFDWQFVRPDNSPVNKHIGHILSGEKLVDNIEFKTKLLEHYPQVIGGEMEGSGLWSSAQKHKKSWILIKSVCDWGDGNKHDDFQELAAASAVSLCEHIFNDKYTLDGMK
jgi:nucleoside phosphorylase